MVEAIERADLASIISRYPVRETPVLDVIARGLGFQGRTQYEQAIRKLIADDGDTREVVRGMFGKLVSEIDESAPAAQLKP